MERHGFNKENCITGCLSGSNGVYFVKVIKELPTYQ